MGKATVIFVCTNNSARSQMAEGLLRYLYGNRFLIYSAGTHPTEVHHMAIEALGEIGIDISGHRSKGLDELKGTSFDLAVTVCDQAKDSCPVVPGAKKVIHKGFEDPAPKNDLKAFRKVRDEIRKWIEKNFETSDILMQQRMIP